MRCPSCGFVSFPHLTTCKKCGKPLPAGSGGRRVPVPASPDRPPAAAPSAAGQPSPLPPPETLSGFSLDTGGDAGIDTLMMGAPGSGPAAPPGSSGGTFDFTLPPAPAPGAPAAPPSLSYDLVPAGFWIRVVATFVDGIVQSVIALVVAVPFVMATGILGALLSVAVDPAGAADALAALPAALAMVSLVSIVIPLLYEVVFVGWRGQTPGKILLRLKVVRNDGGDVDYVKSFIRWIGKMISGFTLGIGFLIAAFTANKRALHDFVAGTRVIRL